MIMRKVVYVLFCDGIIRMLPVRTGEREIP